MLSYWQRASEKHIPTHTRLLTLPFGTVALILDSLPHIKPPIVFERDKFLFRLYRAAVDRK